HAVVADHAVVRDVGVGQQPVVIADPGRAAAARGPAVDGDEFAHGVARADHQLDRLPRVLLVLRLTADRRVPDDAVVGADPGRAMDRAMRADLGVGADFDIRADVAEGPHPDTVGQPCAGLDDRTGMDDRAAHGLATTSAHRMSAQAACSPSTRAMPWYSAMLPMGRLSVTSRSRRSPGTTMRENRAPSILTR